MENIIADTQIHEHPLTGAVDRNRMSPEEFTAALNEWGAKKMPFLFLVDFELQKPLVFPLTEIAPERILFDINGKTNCRSNPAHRRSVGFEKFPVPYLDYKKKYDLVRYRLGYGDSYLTNLTVRTKIRTASSLREIFYVSQARYKLLFEDSFLVFSPETFIRIAGGRIFTYPMKGTIDASLPDAGDMLLRDGKEMAEHVTIVDLLRNDLSTVADNVRVARFRYLDRIRTNGKDLLQVSSEITGELPRDYQQRLGDILIKLLPAGSVSGAPKKKTVEIIREVENEPRGYYTGVMGLFDGQVLDSGVMIRFMEKTDGELYYRSGGGITVQSIAEKEYQEAIDKVYVPLN